MYEYQNIFSTFLRSKYPMIKNCDVNDLSNNVNNL